MTTSSLAAMCLAAVLLAGCGASVPDHDRTDPIDIVPDLVIGENPNDPGQLFGRIDTFAADSQGFIYIVDDHAGEIRRFDPGGRLVWRVGRRGKGPGEFSHIAYLGVGFGRVYAVDVGNWRITVLDAADGAVISTHRYEGPNAGQFTNGGPLRVESPTRIHFGASRLVPDTAGESPTGLRRIEALLSVDLDQETAIRRVLPYRLHRTYPFTRDGQAGVAGVVAMPFEPWFVWTPNPHGGATYAWGGDYRIVVTDAAGDTLRILGRDVPPRRPKPDGWTRARKDLEQQLAYARAPKKDMEKARLPREQAQILGLAYSRDGTQLWVQRTHFDADPVYDVFVDNAYACTVRLDMQGRVGVVFFQPIQVVGDRVYHYATHSRTDVPMVVRFDLSTHPKWVECKGGAGGRR